MSSAKINDQSVGDSITVNLSQQQPPLSQRRLIEYVILFFCLSIVGGAMLLFRFSFTGNIKFFYLAWNLFLAWIPFGLSLVIYKLSFQEIGKRSKLIVIGLLSPFWLLFYPNAPYMLTDFIHFRAIPFYTERGPSRFNSDLMIWFDFVLNSLFIFTGVLLAFLSLYILHALIKHRLNALVGWLFVLSSLTLSSFGIYLGRFIRWNSWDLVNNFGPLVVSIIETIHIESLSFTLLFSTLLLLGYYTLYHLVKIRT